MYEFGVVEGRVTLSVSCTASRNSLPVGTYVTCGVGEKWPEEGG